MKRATIYTVECETCGELIHTSRMLSAAKETGAQMARMMARRDAQGIADTHDWRRHTVGGRTVRRARVITWDATRRPVTK